MFLRPRPQPPTLWTRMECNTRRLQWHSLRRRDRLSDGRYPNCLAPRIIQISRSDRACTLNHHSRWSIRLRLPELAKLITVGHFNERFSVYANFISPPLLSPQPQSHNGFFSASCAIYRKCCSCIDDHSLGISAFLVSFVNWRLRRLRSSGPLH
jgi:hypothetical protein